MKKLILLILLALCAPAAAQGQGGAGGPGNPRELSGGGGAGCCATLHVTPTRDWTITVRATSSRSLDDAIAGFEQAAAALKKDKYVRTNKGTFTTGGSSTSVIVDGPPPPPLTNDEIDRLRKLLEGK